MVVSDDLMFSFFLQTSFCSVAWCFVFICVQIPACRHGGADPDLSIGARVFDKKVMAQSFQRCLEDDGDVDTMQALLELGTDSSTLAPPVVPARTLQVQAEGSADGKEPAAGAAELVTAG